MIDHRVPPDENMSDEQLMQYETHYAVPQKFRDKARFILHEREKHIDLSTNKMTLWILLFTIGIAILTVILVFLEIKDRLSIPEDKQSSIIQPLPHQHKPTKKNDNNADTRKKTQNIVTHNTTSIK